jgi:hypothetical protein
MRRGDTEGFYHTLEDLADQNVAFSDLVHKLAGLNRSDVLMWIAGLSEFLQRKGGLSLQEQIKFLPHLLPAELWEQIEQALKKRNDPTACFFHRRQLWFVLQFALLSCKEDTPHLPPDETRRAFGHCCAMANDLLKKAELAQSPKNAEAHDEAQAIKSHISFLITFLEEPFGQEVFARSHLLWLEISDEEEIKRQAKRLGFTKGFNEVFSDAYGLPLREFLFLMTVAYFRFAESLIQDPPSPIVFDSSVFFKRTADPAHAQSALSLISRSPDELAAELVGTARQTWATDITALAKSPLIRIDTHKYVCPDLHLFRACVTHGLFELVANACNGLNIRQLFGTIFCRYIERVISGFVVESPILVKTFYKPVTFVGERKQEVCDGLFTWPSMTVLMEYKAGMLTKRQRYGGSIKDTVEGVEGLLAKPGNNPKGIGQLVKNMGRVLAGEQIRSGNERIQLSESAKLFPMLVVYDDALGNHAVRMHLQNKMVKWLKNAGVDCTRIGPLLLFTTRDIEDFEALAHRLGAEKLMRDYAAHIDQNPYDRSSMFHSYAMLRYPDQPQGGFVNENLTRILTSIEDEFKRRKLKYGAWPDSGDFQNSENSGTGT